MSLARNGNGASGHAAGGCAVGQLGDHGAPGDGSTWERFTALRPAASPAETYRPQPRTVREDLPTPERNATLEWRKRQSQSAKRSRRPVPDYYALLDAAPNATMEELERAYRVCVVRTHPDKFFGEPERQRAAQDQLKALNAAMQVLRDPNQRQRYDAARKEMAATMPLASRLTARSGHVET